MISCEPATCCHESEADHQKYWGIHLDQDLLQTIFELYPEWFSDLSHRMADQNIIPLFQTRRDSPPIVDQSSLQKEMDKNKESLKVKLLLRRPINQLVEQGIMPSLKASPHFHEQRQKLERAKMGDYLKNKIQRRPDRQQLIKQHILEDSKADPSLQDKQRQLKKARLADDLNDRLSHRPGPLELIKGNILQTDEKFAQAVKEGQIHFKRTCEGQTLKHPPTPRFISEEDSNSDSAHSPGAMVQSESYFSSDIGSPIQSPSIDFSKGILPPDGSSSNILISSFTPSSVHSTKTKKKPKPKAQTAKTRTIKFHEYKGPPSAQKANSTPPPPPPQATVITNPESSYDLLLHQQQLFLQWQLEWQQKYHPKVIFSSATPSFVQTNGGSLNQDGSEQCPDSTTTTLTKLEDMKVSDLKLELKRRNLPVSGSKPQLIERLKPYLIEGSGKETSSPLIFQVTTTSLQRPSSVVPMEVSEEQEQMMRFQQQKIEKLQQELQRSQLELQQQHHQQLLIKQHQQQHRKPKSSPFLQQSSVSTTVTTTSQAVKANLAAFLQSHHQQGSEPRQLVLCPTVNSLVDTPRVSLLNHHSRTGSLPNFVVATPVKMETEDIKTEVASPPPSYIEATAPSSMNPFQLNSNNNNNTEKSSQSQEIDDVLDILIQSGDLPASMGQDSQQSQSSMFQGSDDKMFHLNSNLPQQQVTLFQADSPGSLFADDNSSSQTISLFSGVDDKSSQQMTLFAVGNNSLQSQQQTVSFFTDQSSPHSVSLFSGGDSSPQHHSLFQSDHRDQSSSGPKPPTPPPSSILADSPSNINFDFHLGLESMDVGGYGDSQFDPSLVTELSQLLDGELSSEPILNYQRDPDPLLSNVVPEQPLDLFSIVDEMGMKNSPLINWDYTA